MGIAKNDGIKESEYNKYYETSSEQKRMYILDQLDGISVAYNISIGLNATGMIKVEDLENVFRQLIKRHEVFRTSFEYRDNQIVQVIHNNVDFSIKVIDVSKDELDIDSSIILNKYKDLIIKKFDLEKPPLIRVGLIRITPNKNIVIIDIHHIISDGISVGIILKEMVRIYNQEKLEPLDFQSKDYIHIKNNYLREGRYKEQEDYWINKFNDEIPILNMPTDYPRPVKQSFEGDHIRFELSKSMTKDLKRLSWNFKATSYILLFTAYKILLYRYTGQNDIIVGTSFMGRKDHKVKDLLGMYVNTVPIRTNVTGEDRFIDLVDKIKKNIFEAHKNQSYPIGDLIDKLQIKRDLSRNPIYDTIFDFQNIKGINIVEIEMGDIHLERLEINQSISKFDFMIDAIELEEKLIFDIEYCTELFTPEFINRFATHYKNILTAICDNPNIKISQINMLEEYEKKQLKEEFNITTDFSFKPYVELWEETVRSYPEKVAVSYENKNYTYKEFDEKINQLSHFIKGYLDKQQYVGVLMKRSPKMIQTILAIWKVGGIYVPIDYDYPKERIKQILNESNAKLMIVDYKDYVEQRFGDISSSVNIQIIALDTHSKEINSQLKTSINYRTKLSDIAYVIYTSGSTGKPKGAMVEHLGMANHLDAKIKALNIDDKSIIAQNASQCFDISIWQMFTAFIKGAKTVIYSNEVVIDPCQFISRIQQDRITILEVVPSFLGAMLPYLQGYNSKLTYTKYILVTGEAVHTNLVNEWLKLYPSIPMVNAYGPTEASDDITHHFIDKPVVGNTVPIGRPIQNCKIYIIDNASNLCPIGVPGEICVSGICVGRGYLNNIEMTNKVFSLDPFIEDKEVRMYHTGDIGKWLTDGTIEFLGRKDYQVKIRGFRIELEEIENKLQAYDLISKAAVIERKEENTNYLCAYYVAEEQLDEVCLRGYLKEVLPHYMIPSYFICMQELPLTSNGKLNRKKLPMPKIKHQREIVKPINKTEEILVNIWKDVLSLENISTNDNFFEMGGHSLKMMQVASDIHKKLNVTIPVNQLFKLSTIKQLGDYILTQHNDKYKSIQVLPNKKFYAASSAQKRLFVVNQLNTNDITYNMCGGILVDGLIDYKRVESILKIIIGRHEVFRTSFELVNGELMQRIYDNVDLKIQYFDTKGITIQEIISQFVKPFNLIEELLFRVGIISIEENQTIVLIDMHHIISDGVSIDLFMKEFLGLYRGETYEKLRIQYKDYAEWDNDRLNSSELNEQKKYWLNVFKDNVPALNLPIDYSRPKIHSYRGETLRFNIPYELSKKIEKICGKTGTTMYMVLLSAYTVLLYKYTNQNSIVIGTPVSGRINPELDNVMGMFVNTLAIKNDIKGNITFSKLLEKIKGNVISAFENQEYPFDELVNELNLERDLSRNPLFDTMFLLENREIAKIKVDDLTFSHYEFRNNISKFDLTVEAIFSSEELYFNIEYCTDLFERETIERFQHHFINVLSTIADNYNVYISKIDILSEAEKNHLLYALNDSNKIYKRNITVYEMFERQVELTPNAIALIFGKEKLTYHQLNQKANKLAWHLKDLGVGENTVIGLMVERSFELVIGVLGIMKAGGAYAPIDCDYPEERIGYILNNLDNKIVLTQSKYINKLSYLEGTILAIDEIDNNKSLSTYNLGRKYDPERLMYVLYTSGSTGMPKGVMVKSDSFTNLINWFNDDFNIGSQDNILLIASTSFDLAQKNMYSTLVKGGKLTLFTPGMYDYEEMLDIMSEYNITIINCTPSAFNPLVEWDTDNSFKKLISLRYVFLGGEPINLSVLSKWFKHSNCNAQLVNTYGPTECTDIATSYVVSQDDYDNLEDVPIGKPIYNVQLYVCNKDRQLTPEGLIGELYIGGEGVSLGYYNNIKLTDERFVKNPYIPDEIMYQTGDLVKWLPDGNLRFLGRVDSQVKIRGYRIELGEIESVLLKDDLVKEATVLTKGDRKNPYLCAFISGDKKCDIDRMKEALNKVLPHYMVPSAFVFLDKMPLTPNGKINKNKLLSIKESNIRESNYVAPENKTQVQLIKLCEEILDIKPIGIKDDFFEIGGHSLRAVTLVNLIYKTMDIKLTVIDIFENHTIEQLAKVVDKKIEEMNLLEMFLSEIENDIANS